MAAWFGTHGSTSSDALERLARLTDGFEAPYSLELLATVHYAAASNPATSDLDELTERVRNWSGRKARLFTAAHIRLAHDRLNSGGLLPALSVA